MSLFEQATRAKLRFPTIKGDVTTEQLWDMPLERRDGFDLDNVARTLSRDLSAAKEGSFVRDTPNEKAKLLQLRLDVVVHIIEVKKAEAKAAIDRSAKAERKYLLQEALHEKKAEALKGMTPEQIQAELKSLEDE